MAPGLPPARRFDPLSLSSDGLNHAQTSELGRLFHLGGAAFLFAGDLGIDQVGCRHTPYQGPDADHFKNQDNNSKLLEPMSGEGNELGSLDSGCGLKQARSRTASLIVLSP